MLKFLFGQAAIIWIIIPSLLASDEIRSSFSQTIQKNINSSNIEHNLRVFTKQPHLAGTQENQQVEKEILKSFLDSGLEDVHSIPYNVLLSYPDYDHPNTVIIKSSKGEELFRTTGISPSMIPEEQSSKRAGHQWVAWSANGSASGEVVYVNRGNTKDFEHLESLGIDVKGKIALMRYGEGFRGDKVFKAQRAGAIGVILFSDPYDVARDGTEPENVYPNSIWMPNEAVQRGSSMHGFGDPLSPLYPSKSELFRSRTIKEAKENYAIPSIPVVPVSYNTALQIISRIKGPPVPTSWQGFVGKNLTYRIGPGFLNGEKLTINVHSELKTKEIRNVIGYIRGSEEPDRYVILGNHYDAWSYGSIDPNSGTAVMVEVARAMMQSINETRHRPARTIVFIAWDAEEYGLIGSTEFVEEFVNILQKRAVVYINLDCIINNASLAVRTVPLLEHVVIEAAKRVENPSKLEISKGRKTLFDTWLKVFPSKKEGIPHVPIPGGDSDQAPFLNFAGIPVITFSYLNYTTYDLYPLYHTMYETPFLNTHLLDTDGLAVHTAIGKYWAELAIKFADDVIVPLNTTHLATQLLHNYLPELESSLQELEITFTGKEIILSQLHSLQRTTEKFLVSSKKFHSTNSSMSADSANQRLMSIEQCFINPRGVSKTNLSARHVLFSTSDSDTYAATMMAGIYDAIYNHRSEQSSNPISEITNQISIVQFSVFCATQTLADVI